MVSRFRRERSLRRRAPSREPLPRILLVCEGTTTEPKYFDEFRREVRTRLVEIIIDDEGGVPRTLVQRAAARMTAAQLEADRNRDENLKYDEDWCVFDVDDHPGIADARQQARDNDIQLAISNPCFELWLVLHFQDQTAHIARRALSTLLRKYIPKYKKYAPLQLIRAGYEDAVRRAMQIEKRSIEHENEGGNPTTSVYRLTERISNFSK